MTDPEDLAGAMLIYDGVDDDSRLAGFMYMAYRDTAPEGFVGDLDQWHFHTATCIVQTPEGIDTPFGADLTGITEEMCEAEGGVLIDFTGYMVHLWTVPDDPGRIRLTSPLTVTHAVGQGRSGLLPRRLALVTRG